MKMREIYAEHLLIDKFGFSGSFHSSIDSAYWEFWRPSKELSSFIDPWYFMTDREYSKFKERLHPMSYSKALNSIIENVKSVLYENPEDLEWTQFTPLCDTAVYYFIDDFEEFDADLIYDSEEEYEDDEEELDFTGDFDIFDHCDSIGIKLPRFDEAVITYRD
jgi:hypothetical protein